LCGRKLHPGDQWIVEHVIALENGGSNDWDNLGITCSWCKLGKDRRDHAQAAKQRRVATRHLIPRTMRPSKGWNKKFKKKINGKVVPRDEYE
jgi:5-methylcytosine-specific restriction endonuclease McrA